VFKKALAASALLVLTAACGVTEVDVAALEQDIVSEVKKQSDIDVDASCPEQVDWNTGESFTCDVEYDDGSSGQVDVKMIDDDGNVEWSLAPVEE
jgi:hypothetical protein